MHNDSSWHAKKKKKYLGIFQKKKINNLKKSFKRNADFDYKTDTVGWAINKLLFDMASPAFGNLNIIIFPKS